MDTPKINCFAQEQIENIRNRCKSLHPLVVIRCITYNHENYIRMTLDGFVMQKTGFPFVVIIHDDSSSDATPSIIQEYAKGYPDIIFPIFEKENLYSKHDGEIGRVMSRCVDYTQAKYIALCEGDDYWTDCLKLQKQVDYLEAHPEVGMCYTRVERLSQATGTFIDEWGGPNVSFEELLLQNTVPTLTTVFRTNLFREFRQSYDIRARGWKMGDYPMWLFFSLVSKIHFIPEVTAVYRVLTESASHSKILSKSQSFKKNFYEIRDCFIRNNVSLLTEDFVSELARNKYRNLLPGAVLLSDNELLDEAKDFFLHHRMTTRDFLLLRMTPITKLLLKLRYRCRGYIFSII